MMQVKLKVLVGKSEGKEIPIPVPRFLIGRAEDCHMRPKSDAISRNHCAILVGEDQVVVRDLNSRNGTFVNGQRVEGDHPLSMGDRLGVGGLGQLAAAREVLIAEAAKKPKEEKQAPAAKNKTAKKKTAKTVSKSDSNSVDFDVSEWLDEADSIAKVRRQSEPETRQFQLEETDQLAVEPSGEAADKEGEQAGGKTARPEKKSPGKLPQRPTTTAASSRDAAADMLKKLFSNR